jgi:putative tricarboxylic transport membrane protein
VRANDALSGLVLIILAAAMIALTASFPSFPGQKYGPALFPRILGTGIIICGAILVWHGLATRRAGAPWVEVAPWVREPWRLMSFLLVIAMLVFYILAAESIGFIPIAFVFLLALFLWLGVRPIYGLLISAITTVVIFYFFALTLRVPLPRGLLTNFL